VARPKSVTLRITLSRSLFTVLLLSAAWALCLTQATAPGELPSSPAVHFLGMWKHPYFYEVMVASVFGWVLGLVKGFSGAKDWLDQYWPSRPAVIIFLLDLLIFVVCGAFFGTGIYDPRTMQAALAAGLSWPVGLGALATK